MIENSTSASPAVAVRPRVFATQIPNRSGSAVASDGYTRDKAPSVLARKRSYASFARSRTSSPGGSWPVETYGVLTAGSVVITEAFFRQFPRPAAGGARLRPQHLLIRRKAWPRYSIRVTYRRPARRSSTLDVGPSPLLVGGQVAGDDVRQLSPSPKSCWACRMFGRAATACSKASTVSRSPVRMVAKTSASKVRPRALASR